MYLKQLIAKSCYVCLFVGPATFFSSNGRQTLGFGKTTTSKDTTVAHWLNSHFSLRLRPHRSLQYLCLVQSSSRLKHWDFPERIDPYLLSMMVTSNIILRDCNCHWAQRQALKASMAQEVTLPMYNAMASNSNSISCDTCILMIHDVVDSFSWFCQFQYRNCHLVYLRLLSLICAYSRN